MNPEQVAEAVPVEALPGLGRRQRRGRLRARSSSATSPAARRTSPSGCATTPTTGCCAARRSVACSPPPTTWAASTACRRASAAATCPCATTVAMCDDPDVHRRALLPDDLRRRHRLLRRRRGHRPRPRPRRSAATDELIDVLARLHAVDYEAVGLGEPGQARRASSSARSPAGPTQWEKSKDREIPAIDEVARRLERSVPAHTDYVGRARRLQLQQHHVEPRRPDPHGGGARLGDVDPRRPAHRPRHGGGLLGRGRRDHVAQPPPQPHRVNPGFPGVDHLLARYEATSGRSVRDIDVYRVLAVYKLAIIVEGNLARIRAATPTRTTASSEAALVGRLRRPGPRHRRRLVGGEPPRRLISPPASASAPVGPRRPMGHDRARRAGSTRVTVDRSRADAHRRRAAPAP